MEYGEAVRRFYACYAPLREKYSLRLHMKASIYDDAIIEIYRYEGETRKELVLRVKEKEEIDSYVRATEQLEYYRRMKEAENEDRRG